MNSVRTISMVSLLCMAAIAVITVSDRAFSAKNSEKEGAGRGEHRSYGEEAETREKKQTFLDTLNRGGELKLEDGDFGAAAPVSASEDESGGTAVRSESDGFRVQCFASSNIENVRAAKREVSDKMRYPAYISYDEPYYRLHVGDFTTRKDAEAALSKIKKAGYQDAWIVGAKIFVRQ